MPAFNIVPDLKYGVRMLGKNPGFTAVAVLTIALGVGANTAIFSVVKAVLLDQLPYHQPDRLVTVAQSDANTVRAVTVDFTTTHDLRERARSFESMSLYRDWRSALVERGEPELVNGLRVNHDYFDTLGVKMQLGRTFRVEEDTPDRWHVLILTHGFWLRRFGGDPGIVGRMVRLNEASFLVLGVLPASFTPLVDTESENVLEMYAPLGYALGGPSSCRGCQHLQLVARLTSATPARQASAELNGILHDIIREHPTDYDSTSRLVVTRLQEHIVGSVRAALLVLVGAVGFVLLIACGNVMNLLLARSTGRAKEIILRTALGASRSRLVGQLLTENLLLALAGGALGVLLAVGGTSLLGSLGPKELPRVHDVSVDFRVLLFGLGASIVAGVLFGLAPALQASRVDLNNALKDAGKSTDASVRQTMRSVLIAAELALAFVLVVGAGLLGKSFLHLMNVDPGFDSHNVLAVNTYVYGQRYQKPEAELGYYKEVVDRLRATPGIESAGMVSTLPFTSFDRSGLHIQDRPVANPSDAPFVDRYSASPEYFRVLRIPLKRGRMFAEQDRQGAPLVAIVSESCARSLFRDRDALGKQIQLGGRHDDKPWITIVGIVGDVRQYALDRAPTMEAYIPQAQDLNFGYTLVARTSGDPRRLESAVRAAFLATDKTQPVFRMQPMDDYVRASLAERRFTLALLGFFGLLALTLAAVGIYGVMSYAVSLRTRELGIRLALGAERGAVLRMVLRQGAVLTGSGLLLGLIASWALTRFLSSLLYEVRTWDLLTSAAVLAVLAGVALFACFVPARRATQVDPMVALRYE